MQMHGVVMRRLFPVYPKIPGGKNRLVIGLLLITSPFFCFANIFPVDRINPSEL